MIETGLAAKSRRKRYCDLSSVELTSIKHAVHVQKMFYRDIAEEHDVSVGLVSRVAR